MPILVTKAKDTFTESSNVRLSSHTPDEGTGWTEEAPAINSWQVIASSDTVEAQNGLATQAREDTDLGTDQMDVEVHVDLNGSTGSGTTSGGVMGRSQGGNFTDMYHAILFSNSATLRLEKQGGGGNANLGEVTGQADNGTVKLEIRTAAKKVYLNGVEKISSTDENLTGNNYAGISGHGAGSQPDPDMDDYEAKALIHVPQMLV